VTYLEDWYAYHGTDCNTGYRYCEGDLCVNDDEACPLNDVTCTDNVDATTPDRILFETHTNKHLVTESVVLDDTTCTFNSEVDGGNAIIGIGFVPGTSGSPCWSSDVSPAYESGLYYPLLSVPADGCDDTYGARTVDGTVADIQTAD